MAPRYLDRNALRHIARDCNFRPAEREQTYIHDMHTVRHIARLAGVRRGTRVLHIGAGMGALTLALLNRGAFVAAVEIDPVLARQLPRTVVAHTRPDFDRLTVLNTDALALRTFDLVHPPTVLVSTLPQAIVPAVLLRFLSEFPSIESVTVITEQALAERISAKPGDARRDPVAVKASYFGDAHRQGTVAPWAFWPTPRHHFGHCRLDRHKPARWPLDDATRAGVFELVDTAFNHARISSRNALAEWAGSGDESARRLLTASIDPARRPCELEIADFIRLYQRAAQRV